MKPTFLFSLALLLVDTATSAPLPLVGDVQVANPVNLHNHASIMVPVESRKRTLPESFGSVERRMLPVKGLVRKPSKNGKTHGGKVNPKASPDDMKNGLKDDIKAKKTQIEASKSKKQLLQEERDRKKAENEKFKQQNPDAVKKKEKDEIVNVKLDIRKLTDGELKEFWTFFTKPAKGADNLGFTKRSDIAAAFKKCIPDTSKLLFWSSGDSPTFREGAIKPYAKAHGRVLVADMASSASCKTAGLADIDRKSIKAQIKQWKQKDEVADYHKKHPKQAGKKYNYTYHWASGADEDAYTSIGRQYYWPVMSEGFADAASGEVQYLRPDRKAGDTADYPQGIWKNFELPALKSNRAVKKVIEVTMPLLTNIANNPTMAITPGSERVRHG